MFVPQHDWGKDWGSLISSYPRFGSGGIVGGVPSVAKPAAAGTVRGGDTFNYNTYVTVDSEDMTRKVMKANRNNEDFHMLGRR
jgi:hypothetical protein